MRQITERISVKTTMKRGTLISTAKDEKAESVYETYYDFATNAFQDWSGISGSLRLTVVKRKKF